MEPAEASLVQAGQSAGQSIGTISISPRDVNRSKTATRSNARHGHIVNYLHGHGLAAPTRLDDLDYRHV